MFFNNYYFLTNLFYIFNFLSSFAAALASSKIFSGGEDPGGWNLCITKLSKIFQIVIFTNRNITRTTWGPGRSADLATSSWITFSQQFCFLASYQCRNSQDNFITNQRISTYVIARHIFGKMISSKGISLFLKISEKSQFWMLKIGVPEASHTIP